MASARALVWAAFLVRLALLAAERIEFAVPLIAGIPAKLAQASASPISNLMKTFSAKHLEVKRDWLLVDGNDKIVGRLASQIALRLRGKH